MHNTSKLGFQETFRFVYWDRRTEAILTSFDKDLIKEITKNYITVCYGRMRRKYYSNGCIKVEKI